NETLQKPRNRGQVGAILARGVCGCFVRGNPVGGCCGVLTKTDRARQLEVRLRRWRLPEGNHRQRSPIFVKKRHPHLLVPSRGCHALPALAVAAANRLRRSPGKERL